MVLEKTLESPLAYEEINQRVLKDINPKYSLEGLMLKLQCFGHLMRRANSLEKTLMLVNPEGRRRRGHRGGWHHQLNGHEFDQAPEWWWTEKPGVLQCMGSPRVRHD